MVDGKTLLILGGGALAATQLASGSSSQEENQREGPPAGGLGMGIHRAGLIPRSSRAQQRSNAPNINIEAPTIKERQPRRPAGFFPQRKDDSDGGKDKPGQKDKKSSSQTVNNTTSSSGSGGSSISIDQGTDDSGSGGPQTDTGRNAADTPGIQSSEPDNVTQELDLQQGENRSKTAAEMGAEPDIDLGQKDKSQQKDKKSRSEPENPFLDNPTEGKSDKEDLQNPFGGN